MSGNHDGQSGHVHSSIVAATAPVLLLGGYGSLGSRIARALRTLHPTLPIVIAGRHNSKAAMVAGEIGHASTASIDMTRTDLGLRDDYGIIVTALRDLGLNSLRFAQKRGLPYMALSDGVSELGPLVAHCAARRATAPVLVLGHSIGGVPTLVALHAAREFAAVDALEIGLVFDPADPLGPASAVDMERIERIAPAPLVVEDGRWQWISGPRMERRFAGADGTQHTGHVAALTDVLSLSSLDARSVRVDVAVATTETRLHGGPPSLEVVVEIEGQRHDGRFGRFRYALVDADGYATLSARGVAVAVERLLGLAGGSVPRPGLHLPETIMTPAYLVERLGTFGLHVSAAQSVRNASPES